MDPPLIPPNFISGAPELPADVILIILEELHKVQGISHLRVVSKQFEALATPLSYRHVHLTDRIIAPFAFKQDMYDPSIVQLQVARDVKTYARHLTVKRNMDWCLVAKLIESMQNLRSFTWSFWGPQAKNFHQSANEMIGTALCNTWPKIELHFEGIRASTYQSWAYSRFPNSNLVSCKIAAWKEHELPRIRELLFERPRLQELHLVHGRPAPFAGHRPKIEGRENEHLPALKKLIIEGYDWTLSPWEHLYLWNWSNITHLELRNVRVDKFLDHVPHLFLSGLRVFIEQSSGDSVERYQKRKTTSLCSLLEHTAALNELTIHCNTQKSGIVSLIARNGSHLRTLSLRCFGPRLSSWWTPLTVDQLRTIGSSCSQLMEIKVDLTLPVVPQTLSPSSNSASRTVRAPASTVVTRSMSRVQNADADASNTVQGHFANTGPKEGETKKTMPSWYLSAYSIEKYQEPSYICLDRTNGLTLTAREEGKDVTQVEEEYLAWKQDHRKEEVAAALKNQIHADPATALAGFRNLRRLTMFTRVYHFVPPEGILTTHLRTREAVQKWLNGLVSTKEGAEFEKVVVHVECEVMNEEIKVKMSKDYSAYTYAGGRNSDGNVVVHEQTFLNYIR